MKYAILNTNEHNGTKIGVNIFYAAPIISGDHKGKFATSENALKEFPDIFKELDYEISELEPRDFEIDTTPPTPLYGLGVVIPEQFIWVFPDNEFILEGFEIPLTNGAVDIAYFQWQAFRDCLDNGNHEYLKRALMGLWDYVAEQVENQNFVQL
jgi:hypothetical protein